MNKIKKSTLLLLLASSLLLSGCTETWAQGYEDSGEILNNAEVIETSVSIESLQSTEVSTESLQSTEQEEAEFDPYEYDINLLCEDPEDPTNSDLKWLYINEFTSDTVCKEMEIVSDRVDLTDFPVNENIIYLKITALKGNTLAGIENFPNLEVLFLNGLFINITDISDIYKCPKINTLILRFVGTVEDFSVVSQLPDLEEFVAYTGVPEATLPNIESLASCKKLTKLILQDFDIGSIDFISELTELKKLRLWSSDYMIDDISPLSSLTNLEELEIRQYNSEDIEPYLNLKKLKYLEIEQNEFCEETKNRLYEAFPEGVVKLI